MDWSQATIQAEYIIRRAARRNHRHRTRRALLFAADSTAHAPRYIVECRIPTTESRQQVGSRVPLPQAGHPHVRTSVYWPNSSLSLLIFRSPNGDTVHISSKREYCDTCLRTNFVHICRMGGFNKTTK